MTAIHTLRKAGKKTDQYRYLMATKTYKLMTNYIH